MWVMTPHGYVSAIAHRTKRDSLMVRARDIESLQYMCDQGGLDRERIYKDMPSDYPFRIVVLRTEFEDWMISRVRAISYTNFKSEAGRIWGHADKYVKFLHTVWTDSHTLVDPDIKKENDKAWDRFRPKGGWASGSSNYATYTKTTHKAPDATTPPPPPALTAGAGEPVLTGEPLPTITDLMEMTPEERAQKYADLEEDAQRGDVEAEDLLSEVERLLRDQPDALGDDAMDRAVSIHSLTDEQFAEMEAKGQTI